MLSITRAFLYSETMTEALDIFHDDEPDEDVLAQRAIANLQDIVDGLLPKAKSINDLSEDEQQALKDKIDPHLAFELRVSEDFYMGLPIVITGNGGVLISDKDDTLLGAEQMAGDCTITGLVSEVRAYPVPSRSIMIEPRGKDEVVPSYDQSMSAVIILDDATFSTCPSGDDGTFELEHKLGLMRIIVPIVYGMNIRVADIATLE